MPNSTRFAALFATAAVLAATLVPAFPALADEAPPTPAPSAEAVESAATTTLTGTFVTLSSDGIDTTSSDASRVFRADDAGYVYVDVRGVTIGAAEARYALEVQIPSGVDAASDDFSADLATASLTGDPLVVVSAKLAVQHSSMVNQTPNTAATHTVFGVLVTPSSGVNAAAPNQTADKVAASVAHADDFWKQQSSGTVRFSLAGTVPWYRGATDCTTEAGSLALWNEATIKATALYGYVPGSPNSHLALFLPSGTNCAGALGLGSIGYSTNTGGTLWAVGTDAAIEEATLAHELGHNLSLGHANWLDCTSSTATTGCTPKNYGDLADVMGFGQDDIFGGALSAPQAIRSKIWPTSAYKAAPKGTTSYTLKAVSGNSGLRSVIVEDYYGDSYFVEFRNFTGEDARTTFPACDVEACLATTPGVRILLLEQRAGYKGLYGDASFLLGRTVGGNKLVSYSKGQSYSFGGITIKVTATTASTATVSVSRNFTQGNLGGIGLVPVDTYDSTLRVGDTIHAAMTSDWIADSEKFQWYRNGSKISGATSQNYKFTNADLGASIVIKVTVASKGFITTVVPFSVPALTKAVVPAGTQTLSVLHASPLKAVPAKFPRGTTFTYQWWYFNTVNSTWTKISNATSATYALKASDAGRQIKVVAIPTSAGNPLVPLESAPEDFTLTPAVGPFAITGTQKVANTLTAPQPTYSTPTDGVVPVTRKYVWYRGTDVISGQTGATYVLKGADAGKKIKVKVTASAPGYITHTQTSLVTGAILKGTVQGSQAIPTVTPSGTTTIKLTAVLPAGSITETGVKIAYRWYRSAPSGASPAAISNATKLTYTLTSSDTNKLIWLRVTVTKTGYDTVVLNSVPVNYTP